MFFKLFGQFVHILFVVRLQLWDCLFDVFDFVILVLELSFKVWNTFIFRSEHERSQLQNIFYLSVLFVHAFVLIQKSFEQCNSLFWSSISSKFNNTFWDWSCYLEISKFSLLTSSSKNLTLYEKSSEESSLITLIVALFLICLALSANKSADIVSLTLLNVGVMHVMIVVLEFPPRESLSR